MAATFVRMLVGVAASLERFYKPELSAARKPSLQAIKPRPRQQAKTALAGVIIPVPGITDNWDFLT
jgi:hypothetical protein